MANIFTDRSIIMKKVILLRHYTTYYTTQAMADKIYDVYRKDFDLFDYERLII